MGKGVLLFNIVVLCFFYVAQYKFVQHFIK